MSIGDIQAFIQYSRQFTQPLTQLASMANVLQSGIASAERVFELLDVDEQSPDDAAPLTDAGARRAASSSTTCASPTTPTGRSSRTCRLVAEPGATVAIVGPTGAGQDDAGQPDHALLRARRRRRSASTGTDIAADAAPRPARERRHGAPGHVAVRGHDPREHRVRQPRRHRGADRRGGQGDPRRPLRALARPTATTRSSTTRARSVSRRREAAAHDRPRVPRRTRRSSSSTRPPARSTPAPRC